MRPRGSRERTNSRYAATQMAETPTVATAVPVSNETVQPVPSAVGPDEIGKA